ncbi:hypothetical protein Agub_g15310 [Astrephomene gubernaculifera]|uniref:Calx-beta domain-containing protein n=1 Tax=Astrephomene gubernaculifera TaxID=47775 RepID=A0AAD3HSY8_9CHLO|nr:hypothetical protein Agub_g15310 [Astrephomene gubernaculifera]
MASREAIHAAIKQLEQLLPLCEEGDAVGPCLEEAPSGRGFIIFSGEDDVVCNSKILFPGFNLLPRWLLGAIYFLFLLYLFAGVALASDLFMDGIMQITSTTRKVKRKTANGEVVIVEEPVWNWVVANITLMALGASSPEIMLATVEAMLALDKPAGELGPACIAGAACYNFLIISAVCTTALPDGQYKRINQLRVYITTAAWSLWAHIWMLGVYVWWTPDEITMTEAFVTLGFNVVLVLHAWIMDKQPWKRNTVLALPNGEGAGKDPEAPDSASPATAAGAGAAAAAPEALRALSGSVTSAGAPVHTLAHYRHIMAARQRHAHKRAVRASQLGGAASEFSQAELGLPPAAPVVDPTKEQVMFRSHAYSFLESAGVAKVAVTRVPPEGGSLDNPLRVFFRTEDGDAVAGLDYVAKEGSILFGPGEKYKYIEIKIIDDDMSEPDVSFSVVLLSAECPGGPCNALIVQNRARVTIVDDDDAGVIGFEVPEYEVAFTGKPPASVEVTLVRRRGADGRVQVEFETQDLTAIAGQDYVASSGTVVFESGEKTEKIRIGLLPSSAPEMHKSLRLVLKNPEGGAELGHRNACKVTIVGHHCATGKSESSPGEKEGLEIRQLSNGSLKVDPRRQASGAGEAAGEFNVWSEWREQIISAFSPEEPEEEGEELGWSDLFMHYVNITWKLLLFTCVPPAEWKGGYPCFAAALMMLAGIVYLINEAGNLFGCILGLKAVMVGVSIVALGTSLPDTLASRVAARADPDADAAIGNITGSNSVNVFLGMGLPWAISSVYYAAKGEKFHAPGGDLEFAIMLYAVFGTICIIVLAVARYFGGELGGSKKRQWSIAALLFGLWVLYLVLSGLRAYDHI